jgi:molecular chaperone GrpE
MTEKDIDDADDTEETLVPSALQEALEKERAKVQDHWDKLLRKEAELQNVQRRAKQDVENARKFSLESFVKELLIVVDTFERAMEAALNVPQDTSSLEEGIQLTHKLLLDTLAKFHVFPLVPEVGSPFNPAYHQAVAQQESAEYPPNSVLYLAQKGYLLHGRLLRSAHVVVSK